MHLNVPPKHAPDWTPPAELIAELAAGVGAVPVANSTAYGPVSPRKPWLAAALSGLCPGLGQMYNGQWKKGLLVLGAVCAWRLLGIGSVEFFRWWWMSLAAMAGISILAMWDAWRHAARLDQFRPGPLNRLPYYAVALAVFLFVCAVAQAAERLSYPVYTLQQTSMRPTLRSGDTLRCKALAARDVIRRGQLVAFEYPSEHSLIFVKRVVGLPGEVVEVDNGMVYVNGDPIEEGYYAFREKGERSMDMPPTRLDPGEYYVMGDNRHASFDSRSFGPVERQRMLATPLYVLYSIDESGAFRLDRVGMPTS